jgi:hypothetical protein
VIETRSRRDRARLALLALEELGRAHLDAARAHAQASALQQPLHLLRLLVVRRDNADVLACRAQREARALAQQVLDVLQHPDALVAVEPRRPAHRYGWPCAQEAGRGRAHLRLGTFNAARRVRVALALVLAVDAVPQQRHAVHLAGRRARARRRRRRRAGRGLRRQARPADAAVRERRVGARLQLAAVEEPVRQLEQHGVRAEVLHALRQH